MPRVHGLPMEYQPCLMEYKRWTGLVFVLLTNLDLFFDLHLHSIRIPFLSIECAKKCACAHFKYLHFDVGAERRGLSLCNLASIKLKGAIPVKIVLIKTSIYPCIRACFNWFSLFELKNILDLIWITGCFASIHQNSPDNTRRCRGNVITIFACFFNNRLL